MRKILLVQGANMSRIGKTRDPKAYGVLTAPELDAALIAYAAGIGIALEVFYTHIDGEAIGKVYDAVDAGCEGVLMNPAGFAETALALAKCLRDIEQPYIEIHCQNAIGRGNRSVTCTYAKGYIAGFGLDSYLLALQAMKLLLEGPRLGMAR